MVLLIINFGVMKIAKADESAHKRQFSNPTEMLKLHISEGTTKIVAASLFDLNAIYTPFSHPSLAKNVAEQFTIKDNVIFFQPQGKQPFSIYITQKGDPKAPTYKLTIAPSPIPVGQQIKLIPNEPYFNRDNKERSKRLAMSYPSQIMRMLSDTAKMLSDYSSENKIDDFIQDLEFKGKQYFIGNALINPVMRFKGMEYEIFVLDVLNRSNVTFELVNADFAEISPSTGLIDSKSIEMVSGVGFFPRQVIQPGSITQVIIVRSI